MVDETPKPCPPIPCMIHQCICDRLNGVFPGIKDAGGCSKNGVSIKTILDAGVPTKTTKSPIGACGLEIHMKGDVYVEFYIDNYCEPSDSCPASMLRLAATAMQALLSSKTLRKKFRMRYAGASNSVNKKDKTAFHQERFTVHWIEKVPLENGV